MTSPSTSPIQQQTQIPPIGLTNGFQLAATAATSSSQKLQVLMKKMEDLEEKKQKTMDEISDAHKIAHLRLKKEMALLIERHQNELKTKCLSKQELLMDLSGEIKGLDYQIQMCQLLFMKSIHVQQMILASPFHQLQQQNMAATTGPMTPLGAAQLGMNNSPLMPTLERGDPAAAMDMDEEIEEASSSSSDSGSSSDSMSSDEGNDNLKCLACGKRHTSHSALIVHLRVHSGERPHVCEFCDKTFTQKGVLTRHERIHTGEKPYSCSVCHCRFRYSQSKKDHKCRPRKSQKKRSSKTAKSRST